MQYVDLGVLPRYKRNSKPRKILKWSALVVVLVVVFYASYLLYFPAAALMREILKHPSSVLSLVKNPEGTLKSDDGRTNILLLGIDKRDNVPYSYTTAGNNVEKNGFLTDTMMIVSIDQNKKEVATISIPRDTWVKVPSWTKHSSSYSKINAVYSYGETENYPGGGEKLIRSVVGNITDTPIHYVVRIDFSGFEKGINALGGVDIRVDKAFDDYNFPASNKSKVDCNKMACLKHIHFDAGFQHMNGAKALEYARSRQGTNGEGSDFARAKRQQKVLLAAREKALSVYTIFDPAKIGKLFDSFGETLETDLDLATFPKLYKFSKEVDTGKIKTLVLDTENYLYHPPNQEYGGAYVLLPKGNSWTEVQNVVKKIFDQGSPAPEEEKTQ